MGGIDDKDDMDAAQSTHDTIAVIGTRETIFSIGEYENA
jgi:hypothetical protein